MKHLISLALLLMGLSASAQTIMNIHQNNGTVLQIPLSSIDSITYTVNNPGNLATLTTLPMGNITATSAVSGGNITGGGGTPVTQRGVCWNTAPNPTTANNTTNDGSGVGSYTSNLSGLVAGATYYVRAYATNSAGTAYGNQVQFTTSPEPPTVVTTAVSNIGAFAATSGGNVTASGGGAVTQRGVCWSTSPNPTTANNLTNNGSGSGSFTSNLTGLQPNTTYYVRAYATNAVTTAYGNSVQFTTEIALSVPGAGVTFGGYTYATVVLGNGQEWMAENLRTTTYANGDPIPNVTGNTAWTQLTTGAWAHYENNASYENPYGKLYNWYAVADPRNVCPTNWHVPTDAEWSALVSYLDPANGDNGNSSTTAGGKMKSTGTQYWQAPNTGATNESGFSGLPGGARYGSGNTNFLGYDGFWWSASEFGAENAWYRALGAAGAGIARNTNPKSWGFSVRCLRD
jgi:uncharacterized protein (TIGR02145 family)